MINILLIDGLLIAVMSFVLGVFFRSMIASAEEKYWKRRYDKVTDYRQHFVFRWNAAIYKLANIRDIVTKALSDKYPSAYRGDPATLIKALEDIKEEADKSIQGTVHDVGCFKTFEEVRDYFDDGNPHTYPMIIRNEYFDGSCFHIILGLNHHSMQDQQEDKYPCSQCEDGGPKYECVGQCPTADDFPGVLVRK